MKSYKELSKNELLSLQEELTAEYKDYQAKGLKLDISRGKPGKTQLDLSMGMFDLLTSDEILNTDGGLDTRNYGLLDGIPEAKKLMADLVGAKPEQTIVGGNSSLSMMYDSICRAFCFGLMGSTPWSQLKNLKFLCPVPGYDRHFAITGEFGFEMIQIPMDENGPDMDLVEKYVNEDPTVKGIWCVPKYSNPGGVVYSDETVRRFANLKPAAEDFRIFWDNAYVVHHLYDDKQGEILNILEECEKAGNPDMVYEFTSTSKITFPGAGVAAMFCSEANVADIKSRITYQTIGYDKINMYRHVKFLKDAEGVKEHMKKHAAIIRPKFEAVLDTLESDLGGLEIATWTHPIGGYFVSFNATPGCAKRIYNLCKEAGLVLTGAGAAYPLKQDPQDSNIRIAPTLPPLSEIQVAAKLFTVCVRLATVEKLLAE